MPASSPPSAHGSLDGGFWSDGRLSSGGWRQGVTTRALGDMKEPAARQAALARAGLSGRPAHDVRQVHGTGIVTAGGGAPSEPPPPADGLMTQARGLVLCVYVADCLPIFLWAGRAPTALGGGTSARYRAVGRAPTALGGGTSARYRAVGRAAGVFHAGWRGLSSGMARAAVSALTGAYGLKALDLLASVGPHIGPCCYRVGSELSAKFRPMALLERREGLFLDLGAEARAQLVEAGVPEESVAVSPLCTSCAPEEFFSFRRDKTDSRMMAFLSIDG